MRSDEWRGDLDEGHIREWVSAGPVDLLGAGNERPGLAESGRALWRARLRPRLRRHRDRWLAAGLVFLVAGAGTAASWYTRPPAMDPRVRVNLSDKPAPAQQGWIGLQNLYQWSTGGSGAAADYRVQLPGSGEVVDVLGLTGPGLTAPDARPARVSQGQLSAVTLAAHFDCAQRQWWTAVDDEYGIRVRRTDQYGRRLQATVPLSTPDAAAWREAVQRECLYRVLATATFGQWTVGEDPSTSRVTLSAQMQNPADFPIFLQFNYPVGSDGPDPAVVEIPAHGGATVSTDWQTSECGGFAFDLLGVNGPTDPTDVVLVRAGVRRFGSPTVAPGSSDPYQNAVSITHSLRVRLQSQLDRACITGAR